MRTETRKCPGCGATFPFQEGPHDRYGVSSPECWAAFLRLQAYELEHFGYPDVHRLVVDSYAVQHPQNPTLQRELNIAPRFVAASVQSVAVHLIALQLALEGGMPLPQIGSVMDRVLSCCAQFEALQPPSDLGSVTIANMSSGKSLEEYEEQAWAWAHAAWSAWSGVHDQIRAWIERYAWG